MDNVWICAKGRAWDAVIARMKEKGLWQAVIKDLNAPALSEIRRLKSDRHLLSQIRENHEAYYENLISKKKYTILEMMLRKTDWGTDRYNNSSIHELGNRIRLYYDYYRLSLKEHKISLVLFWNTPHMGPTIMLYEAARSLGITTLILEQSKFPNRFHHYFDFEDWGIFSSAKQLGNLDIYPIKREVDKNWFYMKKHQGKKIQPFASKIIQPEKYRNWVRRLIENNDYLRLFRDLSSRQRRPQAFFRFYTEREYQRRLARHIQKGPCDLSRKFVYFPLHFQPEKVSTNWGGACSDQVLALEQLSKLLPDDWYIYLKESPFQKGAYRDRLFFERLQQIPNLEMVPLETDTFQLTRQAQFVATIVGTVGWEAISGGKNVLTFGWGAWYKTLPGVYEYQEGMDIHDLVHKPVDHHSLEKRVAQMLNKCGTGIIHDLFIPSVENFSIEHNAVEVSSSLEQILYPAQ